MAVVTGNTFTEQKTYSPSSMPLLALIARLGKPMFVSPMVYPYETGGTTVAVPTTFTEQKTYSPASMFEGYYVIQIASPQVKIIYSQLGELFIEQQNYIFPNSLNEAVATQSIKQAVSGLVPPPPQFWS
jgi:hypothetical protein